MVSSALKKNNENLTGTGGGSGQPLSSTEQMALDHMKEHGSDLVEGIPGGFETPLPIPHIKKQQKVTNFINKACGLFDTLQSQNSSQNNSTVQHAEVLAPDTQMPIIITDENGRVVDNDGNLVDLERFGVDLHNVSVPETQLLYETIDEDHLDDLDDEGLSSAQPQPSRFTTQTPCPSLDATQANQMVPHSTPGTRGNSAENPITIPITTSTAQKRKLLSKDTASDFFEDHLLLLMDAGTMYTKQLLRTL